MNQEIEVYCYNWEIRKELIESRNPDRIYAWCLNRKSEANLIRIENQPSYFILRLPEEINGKKIEWKTHYNRILDYIDWRISVSRSNNNVTNCKPISHKFSYRKMMCTYQGDKTYPIITLIFSNSAQKYTVANYFKNPINMRGLSGKNKAKYDVLESHINVVRMYMTNMGCRYCQWFKAKVKPAKNKVSYLENEYIVEGPIKPIGDDITREWELDGKQGVFTFDIECRPDHKGMPNADFIGDQIFSISCMYTRYMSKKYRIINLLLGHSPAPEGEEIRCFETEKELLEGFFDLIAETDPEIITGYNIYGFDNPYLWKRVLRRRCRINPRTSRLINQAPYMKDNNWHSKGYGYKQLNQIIFGGRFDIDVIFHVRANYKLKSNRLDFAARAILGKGKYDLPYIEMFNKYDKYTQSCYYKKYKSGVLSKADFKKSADGLYEIVKYNSVDTRITYEIFEKTGLLTTLREISNITGINPEDVLNRGQEMRGVSTIYNICKKYNIAMNKVKVGSNLEFTGGFVFKPIVGLWKYVICIDFSSLYPSIIIAYNISYDTILLEKDWGKVPIEKCNVIQWVEPKSGISREFRFVKKEIRDGVLPHLLRNILIKRSQVKKEMNAEKDPILKSVLNKKQMALKICANSIYGLTGVNEQWGKVSMKVLSTCVTAMGRQCIKASAKYVEDVMAGKVIYGDTDSIMFTLPGVNTGVDCIKRGHLAAKEISKLYPDPIKFEFEKAGKILTMTKKKYVYWIYHDDDRKDNFGTYRDLYNDVNATITKGNILVRRDNCEWYKKLYRYLLYGILEEKNTLNVFDEITNRILNIVEGRVDVKDLYIYAAMGSKYKNDKYPLPIFREELKKKGRYLAPGERFGFLITKINNKSGKIYVGEKMMLDDEYKDAILLKQKVPDIDYQYYFGLIAKKNVDQLWRSGFQKNLKTLHTEMIEGRYKNVIDACLRYDYDSYVSDLLDDHDNVYQRVFELIKNNIKKVNKDSPKHLKDLEKIYESTRKLENINGLSRSSVKIDIMYIVKTIFCAYRRGGIDTLKEYITKIRRIIVKI